MTAVRSLRKRNWVLAAGALSVIATLVGGATVASAQLVKLPVGVSVKIEPSTGFAPEGSCKKFTVTASSPVQGGGANLVVDVRATQSDGDTFKDLQISFCDPDGDGPATDLGKATTDCDDDPPAGNETGPRGGGACGAGTDTGSQNDALIQDEGMTSASSSFEFGVTSDERDYSMRLTVFAEEGSGNNEPSGLEPSDAASTRWTRTQECSDGSDNDGDGRIDFPDDPGCNGAQDLTESPDPGPGTSGPGPAPAPSPTSSPSAGSTHARSISLTLSKRAARGAVGVADSFARCASGVAVKVQLRRSKRWTTVGSTTTDSSGGYSARLPVERGRYRAVAPRVSVGNDTCNKAISPVRRGR